jgi:cell division protein FtsN
LKIAPSAQASKEQSRVALAPATTPVTPPAPRPAPVAPAAAASSGDGAFSVQLGAPGSEAEARSTFSSLQRRFPDQLSGQSPSIRKADVSGRTVYRLRVGSLSREEAQSMCSQLQSAGGQCFVARN